jgi:hypothetical protein
MNMNTIHITRLAKSWPTRADLLGRMKCISTSMSKTAHRMPKGVNRDIKTLCTATGSPVPWLRTHSRPMLLPDVLDHMPDTTCIGTLQVLGHGTAAKLHIMYSHWE